MTIQAGELWVANIPFTDGSGSKRRPVLVLWLEARIGSMSAADAQAVKQVWAKKRTRS